LTRKFLLLVGGFFVVLFAGTWNWGEASEPASTDDRGWTSGEGVARAAGFGALLQGSGPYEVPDLRAPLLGMDSSAVDLEEVITQRTLLFYFSPGCPHCRAVGPDLRELHRKLGSEMDFLAIASGGSNTTEIKSFMKDFDLPFAAYKDFARKVGRGIKATSTPTVLIVEPAEAGTFRSVSEFRPFVPGAGVLYEMQRAAQSGKAPFSVLEADRYYGPRVCGACHVQELASWALTHHSVAYWTLYEREKAEDTACVGCHVTGLTRPSGFQLSDHESPLTDVTCEACHSPGGPHAGAQVSPEELKESCVQCHDADHSVQFQYEKGLPHIDHFRAAGLSPEDFRAAREAVLDGTAPRPLLAFPEGANVGSDACLSCHKQAGRHWKKSAHGKARASLRKKGSERDVACLSCHAVEKVAAPADATDFHAGGVGCESCHGPGEKHVAAGGGRENIVGLGESCPECIIEAICTRCHTKEQDPDWNLETDLPRGGHAAPRGTSAP
jgi:thiol-disulfide isomerase/thioredoxin